MTTAPCAALARDQREAGEEREADDHARRDDGEPPRLGAGRARRAHRGEVGGGEQAGDGGAAERDDPRVEALERELGRGEGEREGEDPEAPKSRPTPRAGARSARRLRYRRRGDSVIEQCSWLDDNTHERRLEELEAAVAAGRPGDRLPSVRELMRRHGAGPVTVQRAVHLLAARGLVDARPGRGTFVAAARSGGRRGAPRPRMADAGARVRAGSTRSTSSTCCARRRPACSCSPRATSRTTCSRTGALGQALGPRGAPARRVGAGPARGPRAAARAAGGLARRRPHRGRHHRHRRRAGGAHRLPARARRARRRRRRRVADLPRRPRRGPRRRPHRGAGPERRGRPAPRAARRRARRVRRPARLRAVQLRQPARRDARPAPGARPCSRPCGPRARS